MTGPLVVVGDALLDRDLEGRVERLAPDAPVPVVESPAERSRPGGAGLAAALAAGDGREVVLVTALAGDAAGAELATLLSEAGVTVIDLGLDGATPQKVRVRADGHPLLRLDHGGRVPGRVGSLTDDGRRVLVSAGAVLVADYGRGVAAEPTVREALEARPPRRPLVWDPHVRGAEPVRGARLVTPNRAEADHFAALEPDQGGGAGAGPDTGHRGGLAAVTRKGSALLKRWAATGVVVTLGRQGALLVEGDGTPLAVPVPFPVSAGDPCGAGDRFASATAGMLADGALASEAVSAAVSAASAFVAAGGASSYRPPSTPPAGPEVAADLASFAGAIAVAQGVRAAGGTVVATGGCFDLLHAGHVSVLQAARSLGDCLIVCLNSDDSVRRLKGQDRPLVPEADRAAVLLALGCVDAVVIFDEDTPEAALDRLRPQLFAKGADYSASNLPEARLLASWGGQAVVLPYLEGRSTTRLVQEVVRRGRSSAVGSSAVGSSAVGS